jgi:hypothetical protein
MMWQMTWRLCGRWHGDDVLKTCHWRGSHVALMWQPRGDDVAATWRWRGSHVAMTWQPRGDDVAATRRWLGVHVSLAWQMMWQFVNRSNFNSYSFQPIYILVYTHFSPYTFQPNTIAKKITKSPYIYPDQPRSPNQTDITRIFLYVYNIYHHNHKQIKTPACLCPTWSKPLIPDHHISPHYIKTTKTIPEYHHKK